MGTTRAKQEKKHTRAEMGVPTPVSGLPTPVSEVDLSVGVKCRKSGAKVSEVDVGSWRFDCRSVSVGSRKKVSRPALH